MVPPAPPVTPPTPPDPPQPNDPDLVIDVSAQTGRLVTGRITHWKFGGDHLAARSNSDELLVFRSSGDSWQAENVSRSTGHRIAGPPEAWVVGDVEHVAARNAGGSVLVFWRSPRSPTWSTVDVTAKTGHRVVGGLVAWQTPNGDQTVEHLAGRDADGHLIVFWWSPSRDWQGLDVTAATGYTISSDPSVWQIAEGRFNAEYLSAVDDRGRVVAFSWRPDTDWRARTIPIGSHRAVDTEAWLVGDVEHLAVTTSAGRLLTVWRSPRVSGWRVVDVSHRTTQAASGRPASVVVPGAPTEELLATRGPGDRVVLNWWVPSRDWQALDLTELTGYRIASDPVAWRSRSGVVLAVADVNGRLLILSGRTDLRRLTDGLGRSWLGIDRIQNERRKLLVVLWDPHFPNRPKPPRANIEEALLGSGYSVASWYRENSRGHLGIDLVGLHGWYDADQPADWYNGFGSQDKAVAALRAADDEVDFSSYDTDGNGRLEPEELVIIFGHPGTGGGLGRWGSLERTLRDDDLNPLILDGVGFGDMVVELSLGSPWRRVGLMVHETSHAFADTADLYYSVTWGGRVLPASHTLPGPFSIMDQDGPGGHLDPAHKLKMGWLAPRLVMVDGRYSLDDVETTGEALVLMDPGRSSSEYFIIENRWPGTSHDRNLPARGLAIWHVIEDENDWRRSPAPANVPDEVWDDMGGSRRAIRLLRPVIEPQTPGSLDFPIRQSLWDGSDIRTGYDLESADADLSHNVLTWADGTPSGFAVRDIEMAARTTDFWIETPD